MALFFQNLYGIGDGVGISRIKLCCSFVVSGNMLMAGMESYGSHAGGIMRREYCEYPRDLMGVWFIFGAIFLQAQRLQSGLSSSESSWQHRDRGRHPDPGEGTGISCRECSACHCSSHFVLPFSPLKVILNCSALPCLLHLLSSPKESIRKEACWTISNITAGNRAQIQVQTSLGSAFRICSFFFPYPDP